MEVVMVGLVVNTFILSTYIFFQYDKRIEN